MEHGTHNIVIVNFQNELLLSLISASYLKDFLLNFQGKLLTLVLMLKYMKYFTFKNFARVYVLYKLPTPQWNSVSECTK